MVSFIVPAHNEEASIVHCLSAIVAAMEAVASEHEVIVVDDSSTDATVRYALEHGAQVIRVEHRNIAKTRNSGANEARGDVLFFVDADTLISAEIVHSALRVIEEGAAGGGCVPRFEEQMPLWFHLFYPVLVIVSRWVLRQTGGACVFCTREAFAASGGFSEIHFAAEEVGWIKGIKRHGRFVVLRETVVTSGRSVRAQSPWTIARILVRFIVRGPDGFRDRRGLDLWYRPFRDKAPPA